MIRRYYATAPGTWRALSSLFLIFFIPLLLLRAYIELVDAILRLFNDPPFDLKSSDFTLTATWETVSSVNLVKFAGITALALTALSVAAVFLTGIGMIISEVLRIQWNRLRGNPANKYHLASQSAKIIHLAAQAYRRPLGSMAQQEILGSLASALQFMYDEILHISDTSTAVHRRLSRRRELRKHHLKVIAVLQKKEAAIDVDVRAALPQLAETLAGIANAYSEGRIGQLLPAAEIDHVTPVEIVKREHFRMVAIAVLLGGLSVLVALLNLPSTATTSLIGAIGITVASMIYGRKARQGMDVLDSIRGIQRPG